MLKYNIVILKFFNFCTPIVRYDYNCIVCNVLTEISWSNNINCNSCSPAYSERTVEPTLQKQEKKIGAKNSIFF